jgi:hypothetical protein
MKHVHKLLIIIIFTLSAAPGPGFAQEEPAPKLVCDEPVYEFGEVDNTKKIEHDFIIRNEGDATLNISDVKAACGCTVANVSTKLVAPGESSTISAVLNLSGKDGPMNKRITVHSNDPKSKQMTLSLKGKATSLVSYSPRSMMTPSLVYGESATNIITVTSLEDTPLEVTIENIGSKHLEAELLESENDKEAKVRVITKPSLPKGATTGRLVLKTSTSARPLINVPFRFNVVGELSVYPAEISLIPRDRPQTKIISVSPGLVKEFTIDKVIVPDESIQSTIEDLKGNRYRIVLKNILRSEELDGKSVKITTTAPNMETIEIPFKVHIRK